MAIKLDTKDWKYYRLNDLCKITMGNKMDFSAMSTDDPVVNFIGRSADNNGVMGKVDYVLDDTGHCIEPYPAGCITIALGGSLGSTYLQLEPFYTSQNVSVIEFDKRVSDYAKLFMCTLIHNESLYKYFPFGRELNTHIRADFGFTIPVDADGNPDWQFMEDYIKSLHHEPLTTKNKPGLAPVFNPRNWKEFRIIDLFDIKRGSITSLNEIDEGPTPIVSASGDNEGIAFYGDVPALYNNNITISMNGVNTGFTAYHGYDFNINVDCCALIQQFNMNQYVGEFIATIIGMLRYKYSYGRKMSAERIETESIKLPIDTDGNPDWKFMEDYIKALPYGDRI